MPDFIKNYNSLNTALKERFGQKVYRIALNGGMTCPNRDGTLGHRGCIFCSRGGSGEFAQSPTLSITEQIEEGKKLLNRKQKDGKYIAYFQAFTNTYAPLPYLEKIFTEAINHPDIVALSIATRPDCLPEETVSLISNLNKTKPVWVELGLQTSKESSAQFIRRGYENSVYEKAVYDLKNNGIEYIVHIILGLPGETKEDMLNTVKYVSAFEPNGIKLQLLHVLKDTDLADCYMQGQFETLTQEEYIDVLITAIEHLPKKTIIHRLTGDSPHGLLIAPKWSDHKWEVLNAFHREMENRGAYQGRLYK